MRKHGGTPSRRDKHITLASISPPGDAQGRLVGGHQSGLAGCKPPPLFKRGASSCSSQRRHQQEPWGASPRPRAPTYRPTLPICGTPTGGCGTNTGAVRCLQRRGAVRAQELCGTGTGALRYGHRRAVVPAQASCVTGTGALRYPHRPAAVPARACWPVTAQACCRTCSSTLQ